VTQWRSVASERESGQAAIEYALVLALVAAGLLIALLLLRNSIGGAYDRVAHRVDPGGTTPSSETGAVSSGQGGAAKAEAGSGKEH
jgi:Flp pilus assembly pilin Flp